MKSQIAAALFCFTLIACNHADNNNEVNAEKKVFNCNEAINNKTIYSIADSLINKSETDDIWNLSEIDTTDIFRKEDYFTNPNTKNRLVLVKGSAGMSAGTANHLLILFAYTDSLRIVWAGQVGAFNAEDIKDLNNDGIKEIICTSEAVWMGECSKSYSIFNLKDGKQNFLYSAYSSSMIGCGYDNLDEFKPGDTLETEIRSTLLQQNDAYMIQRVSSIKVHNGGDSTEAVIHNVLVHMDTAMIKLQ